MAEFDFDKDTHRRGSGCMKWDEIPTEAIPMWVADMDFEAAPCIQEALRRRVAHGVFGYTHVGDSYYQAVINWFSRRHHWQIKREWMLYTSGVVPAVSCAIKAIAMPGERVVVMTPVYNCFFSSIKNNGCEVVESKLRRKGDSYEIDFDDFEAKCSDEKATIFLLCNPHNPAGRVWRRDELQRINDICRRHNVRVVADEIHCELVMPNFEYTPFASVSAEALANSVTLNSPSKSFNTAGLQIANIICADAELRRRIDRAININEVCDVNPFGPVALEAAYGEGEGWLDALNNYLYANYQTLCQFFEKNMPQVKVTKLEGTYLVWLDITALGLASDAATEAILNKGKVYVSSGTMYGQQAGEGYLRLNIACPRWRMLEALKGICKALSNI